MFQIPNLAKIINIWSYWNLIFLLCHKYDTSELCIFGVYFEWLFYSNMLQVECYLCVHKDICLIFSHLSFTIIPSYFYLCQYINLKFTSNFTSRIYFMLYYFGIISILKVYLCVVFWLSMFGNHDRVYSPIYFSPRVFSIYGLYYYSMNIHCNTLLLLRYSNVRFLWSVYVLRF